MPRKHNALVILSLPFQRLIRSHLSPPVLKTLSRRGDLVLVSPFAETPEFIRRFSCMKLRHILSPSDQVLAPWWRWLHQISTFLRVRGYWFLRRREIPYFWANRHYRTQKTKLLKKVPLIIRPCLDVVSWFGIWQRAWRLVNLLHGNQSYRIPALEDLARKYKKVALIQTASWGFQEAALGWLGRKYRWNVILFPYSMDQLFCNGHLLNDFHRVLTQAKREIR